MLTHTEKYSHKGKSRAMQWPDQRRERRGGLRLEVFSGRGGELKAKPGHLPRVVV